MTEIIQNGNKVTVKFAEKFKGKIDVVNIAGQIVKSVEIKNETQQNLNIEQTKPGIYIIQITDKHKFYHHAEKIIK